MNSLGIDKPESETRVVVAMSGGVDSSVTAGLLVEQGYDVVGITLQLYDHGAAVSRKGACCAGQDIYDARRVGEMLDIPHYVLNFQDRFRRDVIETFAEAYAQGSTPIPCVSCNQTVKFRDLMRTARDLGADALATGHYVRRVPGADGPEMHRAVDPARDQSYFLFATTRDQLDYLRFPLGDMPKDEVRRHAERLGLSVADKPDSQDICFVPDGDYTRVVRGLRPEASEPGDIVDRSGTILGRHEGIGGFTVGQRRGLGLGGTEEPLYVLAIDPAARRVVVGPKDALASACVVLSDVNWLAPIADRGSDSGIQAVVKLRSMQSAAAATVFPRSGGRAEVVLAAPQNAVAPGQACVFYDGERVLGGGWITREPSSIKTAA
jgi:tRNA-specific 2-thiouridylase